MRFFALTLLLPAVLALSPPIVQVRNSPISIAISARVNVTGAVNFVEVILHQKPPFRHPFLQKVLSLIAFNPQSRPALDARFPDAFDPIRLKTLAFVCTMTHFALANLLKEKRQEFSADEYFLVYVDYLEMDFQAEEPEEFENHLMITLADGKINLGNAEKAIRKKK
ncbi:hypothetical protein M422DRAFT_264730 [Sphaerobolus stellatus SS14]|uniref:DUF6532 domain-containing protein n=1 Tax=Sphaerobolus stellatus (strain SS14) TaxID=990650 RepID=A0A0C9TSS6_SPHS4|nr:hypothetical protein M422DRAFT_264730 [Sphaerobolus stellatus SS14]